MSLNFWIARKEQIIDKVRELKEKAQTILESIKTYELDALQKLREFVFKIFNSKANDFKIRHFNSFEQEKER